MVVLLLPLVAAILIFVEPPPKYGARAEKAKETRTERVIQEKERHAERVIQENAKGEEERESAMPEARTNALQERAKGLPEWAKGEEKRGSAMPETRTNALQERAKGLPEWAKGLRERGNALPEARTNALQEGMKGVQERAKGLPEWAKGLRERGNAMRDGGSAIQEWAKGLQKLAKGLQERAKGLQERLYGRLEAGGLKGDELATVGALTLGYKEELGKELKRHFQASGAAHVLAVSGLHTGIIYGILLGFLTLGGRYKPLYENRLGRRALSMTVIGVMWFYALLTGMTPSVVRAVLMVTIFEIGRMAYRQAFSLNTIAAAAVLILIVKPTDLWSVSFQLSFAATTAIVALVGGGAFSINRYLGLSKYRDRIWGKAIVYFLGIIVVSIAAQLGTLPITMYYFGQISNYFLLTNMIVLPVASLLVPSGLISIALGGSSAGVLFSKATKGLAWVMNHSVEWIEGLPGSTTHVSIGLGMVAIYYVLFIGLCAGVKGER